MKAGTKFTLLHKTKEKLKEMARTHTQHFVDVVVQFLKRPFGPRSIAEQKLTVQQPRPMPNLEIKTGVRPFKWNGTLRKIVFVEVLLEMVFSVSHICSSNLRHHSRRRREVT